MSKPEKLEFRSIASTDAKAIGALANETWGIDRFASSQQVSRRAQKLFVQVCMMRATYSAVALDGTRLLGVLLGMAHRDHSIWKKLKYLPGVIWSIFVLALSSRQDRLNLLEYYRKVTSAYRSLMGTRGSSFDGELTFLVVARDTQGIGLGKHLLSDFLDCMRARGVKSISVFTDTTCNVHFYVRNGFQLINELDLTLQLRPVNVSATIFLFRLDL